MGFTLYQSGILPGLPDKLVFETDAIAVGDFFRLLSVQYGESVLAEILDREGKVAGETLVILNGRILQPPQILDAIIPPDGELVVSALIAGG